ncbi:MAG: hypothetical protein PUB22_02690, partial [Clostridiales bacterium]|nr:hypothetical protein [Clostridiales bacterium]
TSIQATTEPNFYGHKVSTVEITFAEDTDAETLAAATFTLYDRGSANPQFGKVKITDVDVVGKTVFLNIDQGSDKVTDRSRNSFGTLNTTGWYADLEGNIYCGTEQTTDALGKTIYPNTAKKTCQGRELDLILCINETDITEGIMSTDGAGHKLADTVWQDTIKIGLEEVQTVMVDVGWEAKGYTLVNNEGKVPVQIIYPEGYDVNRKEAYPVVVYQCGGGVCYWELTDTSVEGVLAPAHNLGCNAVYDNMMTEWHAEYPEAVVMAVNVHSTDTPNAAREIAGVLDYGIANWNLDRDKILIVGNSQGTLIGSDVIRQRPDLIGAYLECNGNFGANIAVTGTDGTLANSSLGSWTEEEINNIIANNVSVWMFNGETDGNNPGVQQDTIKVYSDLFRKAGKSEQWIADHVRASGLQSWKFKEWGETDHSVTKVVAWNYIANPYNDPNEGGKTLAVGDTYKFAGKEESYAYYEYTMDYDYTVYEESVAEWVSNLFNGEYDK